MFSVLFLHMQHHSMLALILNEVSDSVSWSHLVCFGVLPAGGGQGAGCHRPDPVELGKNATIFRTGENGFILADPISIPLPPVFSLRGWKHSTTHLNTSFYPFKAIVLG